MKKHNIQGRAMAVAAMGLAASGEANAQSAGSWMLRAGAARISPQVSSGDLSAPSQPGTQADITADTRPGGGITYMFTDNVSIDLPLAMPFKHDINGAGAIAGTGKIGEVRALPVTVLGQYRFMEASAPLRPHVDAGLTYARFYGEKSTAALTGLTGGTPSNPTTLNVKSKLATTIGFGASYTIDSNWFADFSVTKTFLKTRTTLSTGQSMDITLNPTGLQAAIGYRF